MLLCGFRVAQCHQQQDHQNEACKTDEMLILASLLMALSSRDTLDRHSYHASLVKRSCCLQAPAAHHTRHTGLCSLLACIA